LIKEKRALERIEDDDNGLPITTSDTGILQALKISNAGSKKDDKNEDGKKNKKSKKDAADEDKETRPRQQLVLSMSMKEIKELMKLVHSNGSKPTKCPLHRDDDLYKCKDAKEQADLLERRALELKKKQDGKRKNADGSAGAAAKDKRRKKTVD